MSLDLTETKRQRSVAPPVLCLEPQGISEHMLFVGIALQKAYFVLSGINVRPAPLPEKGDGRINTTDKWSGKYTEAPV